MPRRLALSLLIAWLAWIPTVSAQGPIREGMPESGFHGMVSGDPYAGRTAPAYYQQQPTLQEQLLPTSRGPFYDMDSVSDLGLAETFSRTWFRAEYLLLNYRDPDVHFLGATPATLDPNSFFPAIDRITGVRPNLEAGVPNLQAADNRNNNGFRLTMGIPTQLFTFEASVFAMGMTESQLQFPLFVDVNNILSPVVIPVIPLTRNGVPSDVDFILFDQGLDVKLRTNLQGTDIKFVFGALTPNLGTEVAPLIGFNYVRLANEIIIRGDDAASGTSHLIESNAYNNIYGPEIGLRMETRGKWVTLGFEPKFTFGINSMKNRVRTEQIFDPLEANRLINDRLTRFSPVIELATTARIRLAENVSLSLGYQFMATTSVSFAERNINWDSSSLLAAPPQIRLDQQRSDFWMQGINVGLQWQF